MDWNQNAQISNSPPKDAKTAGYPISSIIIDKKMNNIAKLRQQFVEEIKNIEFSLKESIQNLKLKISEVKNKTSIITEKLRESNKLLCDQSEIIYMKEHENKILREKVEELYEYQKKIFENMEDIFNTLNAHEHLSNQLANIYDNVMLVQENNNAILEEKLNALTPDENYCKELNEITIKINELENENKQNENEISHLEMEIKSVTLYKEQQQQKLKEYEKKINELEINNTILKENANTEKNNLTNEAEKIINETNARKEEIINLDKDLSELEIKLKTSRDNVNEIEKELEETNNKIDLLIEENKQLDETRYKEEQENLITLEKLQQTLKSSKDELASVKQAEIQATSVLKNKIQDLNTQLKDFDDIELKYNQIKLEIAKEEEAIKQITTNYNDMLQEHNNKIKLTNDKIIQNKIKLNDMEHKILESEEIIISLEREIKMLNTKLDNKSKKSQKNVENHPGPTSINQRDLPDLFVLENIGNAEKQKGRKKLYTPTLADDDLELDALSLEEQFTRLTQTNNSQTESLDKNKKFFKHLSLSQSKTKKETAPRVKGRKNKVFN